MAWTDRIREAAYTSPGGTRTVFNYENVTKTVDKKTSAFDFPDADGTYIQDLGHSGRRYPLRVIFWGADYDLTAELFEQTLLERGAGRLEHPIYGTVDVVPFGSIKRRDDLKTAANQSIIEVEFWETIGVVYPTSQQDPESQVSAAIDEFNQTAAASFESSINTESAISQTTVTSEFSSLVEIVSSGLGDVAAAQDDIKRQFDTINQSINQSIDLLIAQPLTLAFQSVLLVQMPALAAANISARLEAYRNLLESIVAGDGAVVRPETDAQAANTFFVRDLYSSAYVSAMVLSVINNEFTTRPAALEAASYVLEQFESLTEWRDNNFSSLGEIDTGETYQKLQQAVALVAGFLVDISFSLKQERRIVLTRARTIIDLAAELYGSVDDQLDFLINSNNLTGSEILEIPAGREIVYYV